jgi:hypothetical protein
MRIACDIDRESWIAVDTLLRIPQLGFVFMSQYVCGGPAMPVRSKRKKGWANPAGTMKIGVLYGVTVITGRSAALKTKPALLPAPLESA